MTGLELSDLIIEHSLYEASYVKSHFLHISNNPIEHNATAILALDNGIPIGLLLVEGPDPLLLRNMKKHIRHKGNRYSLKHMGAIGIYVKNSYRGKGIASKLAEAFSQYLYLNIPYEEYTVYFVTATEDAYNIVYKNVHILVCENHVNQAFWLHCCKSYLKFNPPSLIKEKFKNIA